MDIGPLIDAARLTQAQEGLVLLDVRPREAYLQGHLPGARWVDLEQHLSTARDPGFDPAAADRNPPRVVVLGPPRPHLTGLGAGHDGGRVVFEGTPAELVADAATLTGQHLAAYVGA